ncbi:MAG: EcsC family protein [Eubacteriales bacterium]|nr:EcsC family protein [Eubacteriales bacterium]
MKKNFWDKEWTDLLRKEEKYIYKHCVESTNFLAKLQKIVPDGLQSKLDAAFIKAFQLIFDKGTIVIEKTYNKEKRQSEYKVREYAASIREDKQNVRAFRKKAAGYARKNLFISSAEGIGLGLLGVGLPDIPLFVSVMLRNLYEISLSFGYDYDRMEERFFQLKIIEIALYSGEEMQARDEDMNVMCQSICGSKQREDNETLRIAGDINEQIRKTAKALSDDMLYAKFLQGQPIVGAIGGAMDMTVLNRISTYAMLKYRRRYLLDRKWKEEQAEQDDIVLKNQEEKEEA